MVSSDSNVRRSIGDHAHHGIEHSDDGAEPAPLAAATALQPVKVPKELVGSVNKMNYGQESAAFRWKDPPMKRLLIVAFIGFVLAMWSVPLACLARTVRLVNETGSSIVVQIKYAACRSDNFTLAPGKTWSINAGGCPVTSTDVRMTDSKGTTTHSCNGVFNPPKQLSRFAVVRNGNDGCVINSSL